MAAQLKLLAWGRRVVAVGNRYLPAIRLFSFALHGSLSSESRAPLPRHLRLGDFGRPKPDRLP